jgi:hypothetical protein
MSGVATGRTAHRSGTSPTGDGPHATYSPRSARRPLRLSLALLHLRARIARWRRWEFWPALLVYAPLVPYLAWLALRHRSLTVCTAANPCMPLGGIVGESKWSVLELMPPGVTVASALVPPGPFSTRAGAFDDAMRRLDLPYPIVLKPDIGERGSGVRLIHNRPAALDYLAAEPAAVLVQAFHPGPHEAGVFYVRTADRGHIFSITDKRFPVLTADGVSTLRELILRHERFRTQAALFLNRIGPRAHEVPARGVQVPLGFAGNHCQGTTFLDGASLITPALTDAIDAIARAIPGFHFGRFDIRYRDRDAFAAGRDFAIVELNGLLSESTNIYDPSMSFWSGQRVLRRQWRLAFEIGAANRRDGAPVASLGECLRTIAKHLRRPRADRPE